MVLFCLGSCGGCLGGVMVLGMSSLCHDVGLIGVCSLFGVDSYSLFRWVFDSEWGSCEVGVLLMYR